MKRADDDPARVRAGRVQMLADLEAAVRPAVEAGDARGAAVAALRWCRRHVTSLDAMLIELGTAALEADQ